MQLYKQSSDLHKARFNIRPKNVLEKRIAKELRSLGKIGNS